MSEGFDVDTTTLRRFRAAVERTKGHVDDLRGLVGAAGLAPGTFTRTAGGQLADNGHAEMLGGIRARLDAAVEQLGAVAEATARTIDNYENTDASHAAAMSDVERQLDSVRGHER